MRTSLFDERGSILLLQVLCVVVVVLVISVICDVGAVIGVRRNLAATADQAAIAGAQAMDLDAYYSGGADRVAEVALDDAAVGGAVRRYLAPAISAQVPPGLALDSVEVEPDGVRVQLSARAELPFASALGIDWAPVSATAHAALYVQPTG